MARFIEVVSPITRFLPEVKPPIRRVSLTEKLFWSAIVLIIYLFMCEVPLYGLYSPAQGFDPLRYMRIILAARRGTLMELGIGPIVTAGLIMQLLAGSKIIDVDFTKPEDRAMFTAANKFLAIVMTAFEASAYLLSGAFGALPTETAVIIFAQLMAAGVIIILLDELVQKGWGIGSGISLFIAAGVAQRIWWMSFSPYPDPATGEPTGAIVAFFASLLSGLENVNWTWLFYRGGRLPDLIGFFTTVAVFLIVIYLEGIRVELPLSHAQFRGFRGRYPVKLLYVSNIPVILASALFADIYFIGRILWERYNRDNSDWLLNMIAMYDVSGGTEKPLPGCLVYYVTPPRSIGTVMEEPVRAVVYLALLVAVCIIFSITWVEIAGLSARDVAKQLIDAGMQVPGFRRSERPVGEILGRYIPAVTVIGGFIVGLIAGLADWLGVFGTGMGVLLTVGILYQTYQQLLREQLLEMYPAVRRFLGKR